MGPVKGEAWLVRVISRQPALEFEVLAVASTPEEIAQLRLRESTPDEIYLVVG